MNQFEGIQANYPGGDGVRLTARQEDIQLVLAHNQGDNAAFQRLTMKYRLRVYNLCRRILSDEEESEDLTQEVLIKVLRSIRNFQPTSSFYTWVYRITVNCCIDHLRKCRRRPPVTSLCSNYPEPAQNKQEWEIPDDRYNPEARFDQNKLRETIGQAMGQLSEKSRSIIILKDIEGLSYVEISSVLGVSRGAVKSRLWKARQRLMELLEPYWRLQLGNVGSTRFEPVPPTHENFQEIEES